MEMLASETIYSFGEFEVDTNRRLLSRDHETIPLKPKAFEVLLTLIEHRGEILSKDDLLEKVWADQFVEENNLSVHVAHLRKALGEKKDDRRFIITVPGQGYKFVGNLNESFVPHQEFSVETHTVSRIVVEEDVDGSAASPQTSTLSKVLAAFAMLCVAAVTGIGGYLLYVNSRAMKPFRAGGIRRLTTNGKVGRAAALSGDGKLYAFSQINGDRQSLWLGHVEGGDPVEIVPESGTIFSDLVFSPDGARLFYTQSPDGENGSLFRIPLFGGAPEKLSDFGRGNISFDPTGKRFAYVREDRDGGTASLCTATIDGSDEKTILSGPYKFAVHTAAWSPDGSTVAIGTNYDKSGYDVTLVDAAGGPTRRLTSHQWNIFYGLKWQGDGNGLVAAALDKETAAIQLWQISTATGEVTRIFPDPATYAYSFGISSDNQELLAIQTQTLSSLSVSRSSSLGEGQQISAGSAGRAEGAGGLGWMVDGRIIYTARNDESRNIWTINDDGSNPKQLIPSGGSNLYPSASRDGKFIVFQSNRKGNFAIWRADATGENLVQLTTKRVGGEPSISPDGRWVVYVDSQDYLGTLYRIPIEGGEPARMTDRLAAWPGISPDGKLIACGYEVDGMLRLAIIPIDGGPPLKLYDVQPAGIFRPGIRWTPDGKAVVYRSNERGLYIQFLDKAGPEKVPDLPDSKILGFGWSFDGSSFAFAPGTEMRDVVLIKNQD